MPFFSETTFQPKRQFRFLVNFSQVGDINFMCTDAAKPTYQLGAGTTHQVLNHKFKFPGIIEWQDISVNFIDAIEPNVGSKFYNMLLNAGYVQPVGRADLFSGITKLSSTSAIGQVTIMQLDGGTVGPIPGADPGKAVAGVEPAQIVEEWTLHNTFISQVNFGSLSYASEDLVKIETSLVYDYATYNGNSRPYFG